MITQQAIRTASGGAGRVRGGCGVEKGATLTAAERTVMSYSCDRARSIAWGIEGGLPSLPHGVWLNPGSDDERFLGAVFSNVPIKQGDMFTRPSAGGGGYGDPRRRPAAKIAEEVRHGFISPEAARRDYGVVLDPVTLALDEAATAAARNRRA